MISLFQNPISMVYDFMIIYMFYIDKNIFNDKWENTRLNIYKNESNDTKRKY